MTGAEAFRGTLSRLVRAEVAVESARKERALLDAAIGLASDFGERGSSSPPQLIMRETAGPFQRWSVGWEATR